MPSAAPTLPRISNKRSRAAYAVLNSSELSLRALEGTLIAANGMANADMNRAVKLRATFADVTGSIMH